MATLIRLDPCRCRQYKQQYGRLLKREKDECHDNYESCIKRAKDYYDPAIYNKERKIRRLQMHINEGINPQRRYYDEIEQLKEDWGILKQDYRHTLEILEEAYEAHCGERRHWR